LLPLVDHFPSFCYHAARRKRKNSRRSGGCKAKADITSSNNILLGMLITEVTCFQDDSAEIFRFWDYKKGPLRQRGGRGGSERVKSVFDSWKEMDALVAVSSELKKNLTHKG
jgi:hypothetical protein